MQDAADRVALVVVGLLFKNADRDRAGIEHQIFADVTAGVGETVRKFTGSGKQKQARRFRSVGGENDGFGALQVHIFLFVEIDCASRAAALVNLDFVYVAVGANFAFAGTFGERNHAGQRTGFGANFATESQTETAIDAGTAAGARLRKNGHRRRKRIPSEFARGSFKNNAVGFHRQRRHGIGLGTWRIERAGARQSGDADFPFDLGVVGFEIGVRNRPVGESGPGNGTDFAAFLEINFVEAPKVGGEVIAGAADGAAIHQSALQLGFILGRFAESVGLQLGMIGELIFLQNFDFVVREVFFLEVGALFEHHDTEAVGGKFFGQNATGGARTDDYEIDGIGSFVGGLIDFHFWSASFLAACFDDAVTEPAGCQPG